MDREHGNCELITHFAIPVPDRVKGVMKEAGELKVFKGGTQVPVLSGWYITQCIRDRSAIGFNIHKPVPPGVTPRDLFLSAEVAALVFEYVERQNQ